MTYIADIFTHNKVGIPVNENPDKIEYRNHIMTVKEEAILIINGIKYYWWKPDSLCISMKNAYRDMMRRPRKNKVDMCAKMEGKTYKDMLRKEGLINY